MLPDSVVKTTVDLLNTDDCSGDDDDDETGDEIDPRCPSCCMPVRRAISVFIQSGL